MKSELLPLWILLAVAVALLLLTQILFNKLRLEAPILYKEIGEPDIFGSHNNMVSVYKFWRWLYLGRTQDLSAKVLGMVWVLRLGTVFYFIGVAFLVISKGSFLA
jgi:hypothetical protein